MRDDYITYSIYYKIPWEARNFILDKALNLPWDKWYRYTELIGMVYGQRAQEYANETRDAWKRRIVRPSSKTQERLIRFAPRFLEKKDKYHLVELIVKPYIDKKKEQKDFTIFFYTDKPFKPQLDEAWARIREHTKPSVAMMPDLPRDIRNSLDWLYDNDSAAVQAILASFATETDNQTDQILLKQVPGILEKIRGFYNDANWYGSFRTDLKFSKGTVGFRIVRYEPSHFFEYLIYGIIILIILSILNK